MKYLDLKKKKWDQDLYKIKFFFLHILSYTWRDVESKLLGEEPFPRVSNYHLSNG